MTTPHASARPLVPANRKVVDVFLAQDEAEGSLLFPLLMIVGLFAIFYFLLIRPQRKRRDQQAKLQADLGVGDEVVTVGGLYGTIAELDDETVILETSEGVYSRYARAAISQKTGADEEPADPESDSSSSSGSDTVIEHRDTKD